MYGGCCERTLAEVLTQGTRATLDHRPRDLVVTLIGVFGLVLIAVKIESLAGLKLLWLYAFAAIIDAAIIGEYINRWRRRPREHP